VLDIADLAAALILWRLFTHIKEERNPDPDVAASVPRKIGVFNGSALSCVAPRQELADSPMGVAQQYHASTTPN